MRKATSLLAALALLGAGNGSTGDVDAYARAAGNDKPAAVQIGKVLFREQRPSQVLKVYVNAEGGHRVAGLMLSGVKFHQPLNRAAFTAEVVDLVTRSFSAAPVEEVDLWCIVPLTVGKGTVVSGDNAKSTQRTVFTVTVRRGESPAAIRARIDAGKTVYWDALWVRQALLP